ASSYKWLNGGYGNAFMLFQEKVPEIISPKSCGFNSLQGKYKAHEGNFIGKFEPGHQDTLNFGSLKTALKFLKEIGMELVKERVSNLSKLAKQQFSELDLLEEMVQKRSQHSSIFNIKGDTQLYDFLRNENIICSQRGTGIRLSFHYFNTEEELNFLIKTLRQYLKPD
ncbi:MAG: aminotransferase class V-fold PLP-dependent enzyme, partial [Gillisia sp.]|nr:aminotransferase class V-fold PLP-dependent enzyme [Gillisia sp.]